MAKRQGCPNKVKFCRFDEINCKEGAMEERLVVVAGALFCVDFWLGVFRLGQLVATWRR
jgi:hypothetical protein